VRFIHCTVEVRKLHEPVGDLRLAQVQQGAEQRELRRLRMLAQMDG
jgi:hypothetical protein